MALVLVRLDHAVDSRGRTIGIVDAHRDGKRFVVRTDETLSAFLELELAIHACGERANELNKLARFAFWIATARGDSCMSGNVL